MSTVKMANVWDRATEFLSDNLASVTPIALLLILVPVSIQSNLTPLIATGTQTTVLVIRLVGLALALVSLTGQLAIIALAMDPDGTAGEAFALARARLLPVIAAVLVLLIGAFVAALPLVLAILSTGNDPSALLGEGAVQFQAASIPPAMAWGLVIYCLVAGVALLWLSARLVLVYPVIVAEPVALGGLARSFRLTRGMVLQIIGVLLLYGVVSTVATLAAKAVFGSIFAIIAGSGGPDLGMVLTGVIVAAVATAFTVLGAAFTAKLYLAARGVAEQPVGAS